MPTPTPPRIGLLFRRRRAVTVPMKAYRPAAAAYGVASKGN